MAVEDDGMSGVVTAGVAGDVVERRGNVVNDFAFAFVAPLGADDDDRSRRRFVHIEGHPIANSGLFRPDNLPFKAMREAVQEGR